MSEKIIRQTKQYNEYHPNDRYSFTAEYPYFKKINKKGITMKIGDRIKIKNNLKEECEKLGMELHNDFYSKWTGTEQEILDIWYQDDEQEYITVDICVEIPSQCCEKV